MGMSAMLQSDSPCPFSLNSKIIIYNMLFKLFLFFFIFIASCLEDFHLESTSPSGLPKEMRLPQV